MLTINALQRATYHFGSLRDGTMLHEYNVAALREHLAKGALTLADIGTTEIELEMMRVRCCLMAAAKHLGTIRRGCADYYFYFDQLRKHLHKGGLTLADIGTTEMELALHRPSQS